MIACTSPADEPTLADVQRAYPSWACWRAISGLYYARPADSPPGDPAPVKGEDPLDLCDQIRRANSLQEQAAYDAALTGRAEPDGLPSSVAACALTP